MRFRTEIERLKGSFSIDYTDRIVLLGSCFADNVGEHLEQDGFNVVHNPLGPLFNPDSVAKVLARGSRQYTAADMVRYGDVYHCLDFANRYQHHDADALAALVNADYLALVEAIAASDVLIITLGTAKVYRFDGSTVGNCHKLPGYMFQEHNLSVEEAEKLAGFLPAGKKLILTVSPVRYPGEGLARGFLAKAVLRVAVDNICRRARCDYFPAFEIVNDDLRDYRFYASDMRHPSDVAVQYIYEKFTEAYFSDQAKMRAAAARKESLRAAHRQIIPE